MKTSVVIGIIICFFLVKKVSKVGKSGFEVKGGKVFYYKPINGMPIFHDTYEIEEADAASFEVLKFPYAKDANHVFRHKTIIEGSDVNSFELLDNGKYYSKDKNHAYFCYTKLSTEPTHFRLLGNELATDKTKVYWKNQAIENADPITFENLGHGYSRDKNRVYYEKNNKLLIVQNASPINFKVDKDDPKKAIDGEKLFYEGKLISQAKDSFKKLDDNYSMDEEQVFYNMSPLENADPNTFEILGNFYAKDAKHVYFLYWSLSEANPSSFKILEASYAHDGQHLYHRNKKLTEGDIATFKVLNSRWAKDKNQVYLEGKEQEKLDAISFQVLKGGYAKDNKYVYHFETLIQDADAKSFKTEGDYPNIKAYDKYHKYVGSTAR